MINEMILNFVIIFVLLELYEVTWQKESTLMGMLLNMHRYYRKNIFLFLAMNPTFYFSIWLAMVTNYNGGAMLLLFIKTVDLATKIILIDMVFTKKEIPEDIAVTLLRPINKYLPYIGIVIYPLLILTIEL